MASGAGARHNNGNGGGTGAPPGGNGAAAAAASSGVPAQAGSVTMEQMMAALQQVVQAQSAASMIQLQAMLDVNRQATAEQAKVARDALLESRLQTGGPIPLFKGNDRNIMVRLWVKQLVRRMDAAGLPIADHERRIALATGQLRDAAASWYAQKKKDAEAAAAAAAAAGQPALPKEPYTTWDDFAKAIEERFTEQDEQDWVLGQIEMMIKKQHKDVANWTEKFNQMNEILNAGTVTDITRIRYYTEGLPMEYRTKYMEKKKELDTLKKVQEAMLAKWMAEASAREIGAPARLNQVGEQQDDDSKDGDGSSGSGSGQQKKQQKQRDEPAGGSSVTDLISAMGAFVKAIGADRSGYRGGYRGRGRGGRGRGRGGRGGGSRGQSPALEGDRKRLPQEVYRKRMESGVCFNCGQADHLARDCNNERVYEEVTTQPEQKK